MNDDFENKMTCNQTKFDSEIMPSDFPGSPSLGAISGAHNKILATQYQGQYYSPGCTPPELLDRWKICEDLACQISKKSLESKAGKRSHMPEVEILAQYFLRLVATRWTSEPEAKWVIRRVATLVAWDAPPSVLR